MTNPHVETDAIAWIACHGSERLRLGVETKSLPRMTSIYHEERIRQELGEEWEPLTGAIEVSGRLNPLLHELRALYEARKEDFRAELASIRYRNPDGSKGHWGTAIVTPLPWHPSRKAFRFVTEGK